MPVLSPMVEEQAGWETALKVLFSASALLLSVLVSALPAIAECKVPNFESFEHERWKAGDPLHYDDAKYGFAIPFHARHAKGTFYVYDFDISDPKPRDAEEQLSRAVYEVDYMTQKFSLETKLSDPYLVPREHYEGTGIADNAVYFVTSNEAAHTVTIASIGVLHGCFHKIRYTQPVASDNPEDVLVGLIGFSALTSSMQDALSKTGYLQ
ncbi:MAG: hypothetical protein AAGA50_28655 [Pseudomonadota bacterium]